MKTIYMISKGAKKGKDLELFVKAMYRKLESFVLVLIYQVLSSSKMLVGIWVLLHMCHFESIKSMDTFSV